MRDLFAASSGLKRSAWTVLSPDLSTRCLSGNLALGIVPPLAYSDHLKLRMLILLPSRILPFLYRGECTAFDPKAPTVPIRVVVHLALITSVPRDTAALCPDPLGFVRVVHLDLSAGTCPFPLENEPLADT